MGWTEFSIWGLPVICYNVYFWSFCRLSRVERWKEYRIRNYNWCWRHYFDLCSCGRFSRLEYFIKRKGQCVVMCWCKHFGDKASFLSHYCDAVTFNQLCPIVLMLEMVALCWWLTFWFKRMSFFIWYVHQMDFDIGYACCFLLQSVHGTLHYCFTLLHIKILLHSCCLF